MATNQILQGNLEDEESTRLQNSEMFISCLGFVDEELKRGDEITPKLINAIEESSITLIAFFKAYGRFVLKGHMEQRFQDKSSACNLNKHKETEPRDPGFQRGHTNTINQHKRRMETVNRASSFVVSTILFLCISNHIYCSFQSPMLQKVHQEQHGPVSIWPSLLSLLGFMVFVLAVTMMILVGAPFTRTQRAMFVFLAILMFVRSATSISGIYFPILGIFLMGWQIMNGIGSEPRN